jgi:hypothetical protein
MVQCKTITCELARRPYTRHSILRYLVGLGLACGITACAPKLAGPTVPSGYVFSMQVFPSSIRLSSSGATAEVTVRVQDARRQPVDGVPVIFEVEPQWAQNASVSPSQVTTRGGVARTIFTARLTGVVRVMARVDNTTAQTEITVESPPSPSSAGAALSDPRPAATAAL